MNSNFFCKKVHEDYNFLNSKGKRCKISIIFISVR